jgi:uncharacterized protein (DUF58 family)
MVLGVAVVAAALCGACVHPRSWLLAAGLTVVLAVGLVWPWVAVRGLRGEARFGRVRAREGESVLIGLGLWNRLPWGAWGLMVRGLDVGGSGGAAPGLAHAAGWRETAASWEWKAACRGVYPRGGFWVASAFPFGLRECARPLEVQEPLVVWPRTFAVGPIPEAASGESAAGLAPRNKPGTSGDLLGVRPYRRGDSVRRIHWPQTARHGELVVCELHSYAVPQVQLVLDAWGVEAAGDPSSLFEWVVRIGASFAESWIGQGAEVEVICGACSIAGVGGSVRARQGRVLDGLARLGFGDARPLREVLDGLGSRGVGGALRIVVASDAALVGLVRAVVGERFVVLGAAAFAPGVGEVEKPLGIRPWIWVDDPQRVSQQIRSGWKEVALGR